MKLSTFSSMYWPLECHPSWSVSPRFLLIFYCVFCLLLISRNSSLFPYWSFVAYMYWEYFHSFCGLTVLFLNLQNTKIKGRPKYALNKYEYKAIFKLKRKGCKCEKIYYANTHQRKAEGLHSHQQTRLHNKECYPGWEGTATKESILE